MSDPEQLVLRLDLAEGFVSGVLAAVRVEAPNTHQAFRDLDEAQKLFETAFWRARRALEAPETPWKVRHG